MNKAALTIAGSRMGEDGATAHITGMVSEPEPVGGSSDWVCTVSCADLFPDEIIKGASAAQALHLARLFLLDALETNGVTVENARDGVH